MATMLIHGGFFMRTNERCQKIVLALCLYGFTLQGWADTEEDGRFWLNMTATGDLPQLNWKWYAEIQPRWRNEGSDFDQLLIRPAVNYAISPQTTIWAGYAHVNTHPDEKSAYEEHRLWQQLLHQFSPIGEVSIQSRTRIEQRFVEHANDTGHRLRQMVRLSGPSHVHPDVFWVLFDEYILSLNATDYGARRGFDQNRAFAGVSWSATPQFKVEMGYLNQYVNGKVNDSMNHILATTFNYAF